ncbi:MAG: Ig domain-containing protein [bacterium]|nr:Ig domain-containing protein [bacterium]
MNHELRIKNNGLMKKLAILLVVSYWSSVVGSALAADVIGKFPSLLGSDGARAIDADIVWLGDLRDKESNSKQTDADNDDGVVAEFNSCAASESTFKVHLKKPSEITGVAYLNLWADWNRDGEWSGGDECAAEWAVVNYEIDLSKQVAEIQPYVVFFPAGKTTNVWYRAVISYNEKLTRADGGGEFSAGEVEDYGPTLEKPKEDIPEKGNPPPYKVPPPFHLWILSRWFPPPPVPVPPDEPFTPDPRAPVPNIPGDPDFDLLRITTEPPVTYSLNIWQRILNLPPLIWIFPPSTQPEPPVTFTPDGKGGGGAAAPGVAFFDPEGSGIPQSPYGPAIVTCEGAVNHGGTVELDIKLQHTKESASEYSVYFVELDGDAKPKNSSLDTYGGDGRSTQTGSSGSSNASTQQGAIKASYKYIRDGVSDDITVENYTLTYHSTQVHDFQGTTFDTFPITLGYREHLVGHADTIHVSGYNIPGATCTVAIQHVGEPTTPTPSPVPAPVPTPTPSGDDSQKNIVPPAVPPTESLNIWQRIPFKGIINFIDTLRKGDLYNLPPFWATIGEPVVGETKSFVNLVGESIRQRTLCLIRNAACDDGNADDQTITFILSRKEVVIPLPVSPFPRTVTLPTKPIFQVFSPLQFLSERLNDLSTQLRRLVVPDPIITTTTIAKNPLCVAEITEQANQNERYQYKMGCNNYTSCSGQIRYSTNIGGLVGVRKIELPVTGILTNYDYIPTVATVAAVQTTCSGPAYNTKEVVTISSTASSFKSGGSNPAGNTAAGVAPNITTTSLPDGTNGTAYSQTVSATGGADPYQWTIVSGALPTGLSINSSTGVISGTPTATATFNFSVRARTPSNNLFDDQALSIIVAAAVSDLVITTTDVPDKTASVPSSDTISATGGTTPYVWSINTLSVACLVNNYAINSSTGALTSNNGGGTGTCTLTVHVEDAQGTPDTDDQVLEFVINAP